MPNEGGNVEGISKLPPMKTTSNGYYFWGWNNEARCEGVCKLWHHCVDKNIVHTKNNVHALKMVNPLTQLLPRVSIRDPNVMIVRLNRQLQSLWSISCDIFDKCLELTYVGIEMIYICFIFIPTCILLLSWALLIFNSWRFAI
jgi:hypothetical protein